MFYIQIAELLIKIDNRYDEVEERCRGYVVHAEREPDMTIRASDELIERLYEWFEKHENGLHTRGEAEFYSVHRYIYPLLPHFEAVWMHACVVEVDGEGYAFTAPSGYGKTTHARLWLEMFGERACIINGDNPVIRLRDGVFYVYGTPYGGKEGYQMNKGVPLKGICYLSHSEQNHIKRMEPMMAYGQLIRENEKAYMMTDENQEKMLKVLKVLVEKVPVYSLYCNQQKESAEIAYQAMK